jgi:hypothetical protein
VGKTFSNYRTKTLIYFPFSTEFAVVGNGELDLNITILIDRAITHPTEYSHFFTKIN